MVQDSTNHSKSEGHRYHLRNQDGFVIFCERETEKNITFFYYEINYEINWKYPVSMLCGKEGEGEGSELQLKQKCQQWP